MDLSTYARLVTIDTGVRVRRAREQQGLTRAHLADLSEVAIEMIAALEEGSPQAGSHLHSLASAFVALGLNLAETVEDASDAVRREHGDPHGFTPRPRRGDR